MSTQMSVTAGGDSTLLTRIRRVMQLQKSTLVDHRARVEEANKTEEDREAEARATLMRKAQEPTLKEEQASAQAQPLSGIKIDAELLFDELVAPLCAYMQCTAEDVEWIKVNWRAEPELATTIMDWSGKVIMYASDIKGVSEQARACCYALLKGGADLLLLPSQKVAISGKTPETPSHAAAAAKALRP